MKVVGLRGFVALGVVLAACGGRSTREMGGSGMDGNDDDSLGTGARGATSPDGAAASGGTSADGTAARGGTSADPENGGGTNRGGTGGGVRGGTVLPQPGSGGSGATAGSGGVSSPPDADAVCTQDDIRFSVGGNLGQRLPPAGACVQNNLYYCRGESYAVDSGPCSGTCTCRGDTTWDCTYDSATGGTCEVDRCEVDGSTLDIGFGYIDSDNCTYCQCTRQGIVCTDDSCQAPERCRNVEGEYALALTRASRCDPKSSVPQCTARATINASCGDEIPVMDTSELDAIKQRFAEDGCAETAPPCGAHVALGTHPTCAPDGVCRSLP